MTKKFTHMNIVTFTLTLMATVLFLSSCSSGGSSVRKNGYCPKKYNPLKAENVTNYRSKTQLKPGEPFNPSFSDYAYVTSHIYYHDPKKDIRLHLKHTATGRGAGEYTIVCAGGDGISPDMKPLNFDFTLVSDFQVYSNQATKIRTRTWRIDLRRRSDASKPLDVKALLDNVEFTDGEPQDLYVGKFDEIKQSFFVMKGTDRKNQYFVQLVNDDLNIKTFVEYKRISQSERRKLEEREALEPNLAWQN